MKRIAALLLMTALLTGCACARETPQGSAGPSASPSASAPAPSPAVYTLPGELALDEAGVPLVEVYRTDLGAVETMSLESYLMGVVAGEMHNDWPQEALKAQVPRPQADRDRRGARGARIPHQPYRQCVQRGLHEPY